MQEPIQIARPKRAAALLGVSPSTLWRLHKDRANNGFPQIVRLSVQAVGWSVAEIEAWVESRREVRQ